MKRMAVVLTLTLALVGGQFLYQRTGPCFEWGERYKAITLYWSPSPVIQTEENIENAIGPRPLACPSPSVSLGDAAQYRKKGRAISKSQADR